MSYINYVAFINQQNQDNPTVYSLENTMGFGGWVRENRGFYTCESTTPYSITKTWFNGGAIGTNSCAVLPLYDYNGIIGYLNIVHDQNNGNIRYSIECVDTGNQQRDISELMSNSGYVYLPEIRVYP